MIRPRSRRSFLQLSGSMALSVLSAGCSTLETGASGLVLGSVSVRNGHPNTHEVRVELERDNELVREETVTVRGDNGVTRIEATWPSAPAIYVLRYVVFGPDEEPDIRTRTLTEENTSKSHNCTVAAITMGFPSDSNPYVSVGSSESLGETFPE